MHAVLVLMDPEHQQPVTSDCLDGAAGGPERPRGTTGSPEPGWPLEKRSGTFGEHGNHDRGRVKIVKGGK